MTARKLHGSWWVDFRVDYIRYRKKSPENSKPGATAYEATLRHRLSLGQPIDSAERVAAKTQTFAVFAHAWVAEYVETNNKLSEQRGKNQILRASLIPFFGKMPIGQISTRDVERYKAQTARSGISNKTINNRLSVLRNCVSTAYKWLDLDGKPPEVKWLKCAPSKFDYLSREECGLLVANADGVVRELVLTAILTGMRQGELKGLQWSSIDWETRTITVRHSKNDWSPVLDAPKSNRLRHIPMSNQLYEMLAARRQATGYVFLDDDGQPFDKKRLIRRLNRVCARAGIRHFGWHTFRHTFASQLTMAGAPLAAVQSLLGHSTITTTMRYAHLSPSTLRSAVALLEIANDNLGQPVGNTSDRLQNTA